MQSKAGSFTPSVGTGGVTGLAFLPTDITFRAGAATGSTHTDKIMYCNGWTTASNQSYDYGYADGTRFRCQGGTDKCIRMYIWDTSVTPAAWKEVLSATFVSFDTNPVNGTYGFTLNFTAAAGYQVRYIARG
jgi:hypothetical protein